MSPDEKRELLIKALSGIRCLIARYDYDGMLTDPLLDIDALASASIIVPVKVYHTTDSVEFGDFTTIGFPEAIFRRAVNLGGHVGSAGPGYAIIVTGVGDGDKEE